ncbi:hypothetical protein, partial [Mycoplasmopsis cynos]|uniref:hypothetical protein n=1 Tax=Mycoplasmopsis cynos TaxID=171284 RepID=UPI001C658180
MDSWSFCFIESSFLIFELASFWFFSALDPWVLSSNAEEKLNVIQKETEKLLDKLKGSDQYQSILSSIK